MRFFLPLISRTLQCLSNTEQSTTLLVLLLQQLYACGFPATRPLVVRSTPAGSLAFPSILTRIPKRTIYRGATVALRKVSSAVQPQPFLALRVARVLPEALTILEVELENKKLGLGDVGNALGVVNVVLVEFQPLVALPAEHAAHI